MSAKQCSYISCFIYKQIFDNGCEKDAHPEGMFPDCDEDWRDAIIAINDKTEAEIELDPADRVRVYE